MKLTTLLTLAAAAALTACSSTPRTPDYACPLDEVAGAKCASVEQAYDASRTMSKGDNTRVQSVFDRRVQQPAADSKPFFAGKDSGYPEPGQTGMPVYNQPKVMRPWVAPYVDADGNLRSGEYTYFTTPGSWNYGELRKPGASSDIFAPAKSTNLGFTPGETVKAPPAPKVNSNVSALPAIATPNYNAPSAAGGSITQPYQRLPSN
jgi:type IV conjugative transfer system lipoprotein TraV